MKRDTKLANICVDYAMTCLNMPYIWGGQSPFIGFDCSGLVVFSLRGVGKIKDGEDYTSHSFYIKYPLTNYITKGVLVYFGTPEKIVHVGICLNDRLMIEAGNGSRDIMTREQAIAKNAYVRIRPINRRSDVVGFNDPFLKV